MATTYAGESAENKALLDNYNGNLRAWLGSLHRLISQGEVIQDQYNDTISTLFTAWNALEDLPNNSGLAGSSPTEDHEQIETWQSYLDTLLSHALSDASHKAEYVSAAGPDNVVP